MNLPKAKVIAYQMLDVDRHLAIIIETALRAHNPLGLIAVWYRRIHAQLQQERDAGAFVYPQRVEQLQWRFSNSYLNAYQCYQSGGTTSHAWRACFEARRIKGTLPEQQLLLALVTLVHYDLWMAALSLHDKYPLDKWEEDLHHIERTIWRVFWDCVDAVQHHPQQALSRPLGQLWRQQAVLRDLQDQRLGWNWLTHWLSQPPEAQAQLLAEWDEETLDWALQARHPGRWVRASAWGLQKIRPQSVKNLLKSLL